MHRLVYRSCLEGCCRCRNIYSRFLSAVCSFLLNVKLYIATFRRNCVFGAGVAPKVSWVVHYSEGQWFDPRLLQSAFWHFLFLFLLSIEISWSTLVRKKKNRPTLDGTLTGSLCHQRMKGRMNRWMWHILKIVLSVASFLNCWGFSLDLALTFDPFHRQTELFRL